MTISAKLTQNKVFVPADVPVNRSARFAVRTQVTEPTLDKLAAPLIMTRLMPGLDNEAFLRVANPEDLSGALVLEVNPLSWFEDANVNLATPGGEGFELMITSPPEIRPEGEPVVADIIDAVESTHRVRLTVPKWYSNTLPMAWSMHNPSTHVVVASGVDGYFKRQSDALEIWRVDRCMALFAEAQEGLDHIFSVQTFLQSLLSQLALTSSEYLAYPPTNPIVNTFAG